MELRVAFAIGASRRADAMASAKPRAAETPGGSLGKSTPSGRAVQIRSPLRVQKVMARSRSFAAVSARQHQRRRQLLSLLRLHATLGVRML